MKRKMHAIRMTGILSAVLLLSSCSTVRTHPHFESRISEIATVTVIPSDISVKRIVFQGDDEVLFEKSREASREARLAVETELARRGYIVLPFDTVPDAETAKEVGRIKDLYAQRVAQNQKTGKKDFRPSLGAVVNPVADRTGADALFFSMGAGFVRSEGEIAKEFGKTALIAAATLGSVIYIPQTHGGAIFLSLVDGDNGEILWHNVSNRGLRFDLTDEKGIVHCVKSALRSFPERLSGTRLQASESGIPEGETIEAGRVSINIPVEVLRLGRRTGRALKKEITPAVESTAEEPVYEPAVVSTDLPLKAAALVQLGLYRSSKGDLEGALEAYKQGLKAEERNPYIHLLLANSYFSGSEFGGAERHARQAIRINREIPEAHQLLSSILERRGEMHEARQALTLYETLLTKTPAVSGELPAGGAAAAVPQRR